MASSGRVRQEEMKRRAAIRTGRDTDAPAVAFDEFLRDEQPESEMLVLAGLLLSELHERLENRP